jgi:hypothetical protein
MSPSLDLERIESDSGECTIHISYYLRQKSYVRLEITNGDSRPIHWLIDELKEAGNYQMIWVGNDINRGEKYQKHFHCRMTIQIPGGQIVMMSRKV